MQNIENNEEVRTPQLETPDRCDKGINDTTEFNALPLAPLESRLLSEDGQNGVPKRSESPKVQLSDFEWESTFAQSISELPSLSGLLYDGRLPEILNLCWTPFSDSFHRDVALLSSIAFCSGIFPQVSSIYSGNKHYSNLYLFIISPSSTGKSTMRVGEYLLRPVEREFRRLLNLELMESIRGVGNQDNIPVGLSQSILIKANSSAIAFIDDLRINDGIGVLTTTEGDIIGNTFKQDWGNSSAQWRAAWDHQNIDVSRRREKFTIDNPRLSIIISGTPGQANNIIPNNEDGLHARFLYYCFGGERKWRSPFLANGFEIDGYFSTLSREYLLPQWRHYFKRDVNFTLTPSQQKELDHRFHDLLEVTKSLYTHQTDSVVYRGGAYLHRIAMVLTILRNPNPSRTILCSNEDFENAFLIIKALIQHGIFMTKVKPALKNADASRLHEALPDEPIVMSEMYRIGGDLGISESTVKRYRDMLVSANYLIRLRHGNYKKYNNI